MYYNRHRYYDPEICQYISPDPIGMLGGVNPQAYVHNPFEWVDPFGLSGKNAKKCGDFSGVNSVGDLIESSVKGRSTKGKSVQYERTGGFDQANKDFDSLNASNDVKIINDVRVGKLGDGGSTLVVRKKSSDGRPTLEIQLEKKKVKFRYNN